MIYLPAETVLTEFVDSSGLTAMSGCIFLSVSLSLSESLSEVSLSVNI
jgi:hypothetical protein